MRKKGDGLNLGLIIRKKDIKRHKKTLKRWYETAKLVKIVRVGTE